MRLGRVLRGTLMLFMLALALPVAASAAQRIVTIQVPSRFVDPATQKFPAQDPAIDPSPHPGRLQANILLPDGYNPRKAYPLLLLLHGAGERWDSWANPQEGDILETAKGLNAIVVMPDGALGFYLDWWNDGKRGDPSWERYIREYLIPRIQHRYKIRRARRWHTIAGFSMGGYGTLLTATQNPGYFGTAVPLSAFADVQAPESVTLFPYVGGNPYDQLFGPSDGFYAEAHNPVNLAGNLAHTRMYVFSGDGVPDPAVGPSTSPVSGVLEAGLKLQNDKLVENLKAAGSDVTYTTHLGTHDWPYWRTDLKTAIRRGLFRPAAQRPRRWSFETASQRGRMWDVGYYFTRPPQGVEIFRRSGRTLSGRGTGTVALHTRRCRLRATLPFRRKLPARPCRRR